MIDLDPFLYISPGLKDRKMEICESIQKGERLKGLYVIRQNPETGLPEAIESAELSKPYYAARHIHAVGITEDYDTALRYLANAALEHFDI